MDEQYGLQPQRVRPASSRLDEYDWNTVPPITLEMIEQQSPCGRELRHVKYVFEEQFEDGGISFTPANLALAVRYNLHLSWFVEHLLPQVYRTNEYREFLYQKIEEYRNESTEISKMKAPTGKCLAADWHYVHKTMAWQRIVNLGIAEYLVRVLKLSDKVRVFKFSDE